MFGPPAATASIHVGSLAVPILALAGAVAGVSAGFPRLAAVLVAANALVVLSLYVPALDPVAGSSYSGFAATIAALSLAGFCAVAFRTPG
jgi:hypothetical protein